MVRKSNARLFVVRMFCILIAVLLGLVLLTTKQGSLEGSTVGAAPVNTATPTPTPAVEPSSYVRRAEFAHDLVASETNWEQTYSGAQVFADVLPGTSTWAAIHIAYTHGAVNGYACGELGEPCGVAQQPYFRPAAFLTRGDFAQMVRQASQWAPVNRCPQATFSDVPCGSAYYVDVETAFAHGIIAGYPDGTFRPDEFILASDVRLPPPGPAATPEAPAQATATPASGSRLPAPTPTGKPGSAPASGAGPDSVALPAGNRFGVNIVSYLYSPTPTRPDEVLMKQANTQIVRVMLNWSVIQPGDNQQWCWANCYPSTDNLMSRIQGQQMNVDLVFVGVPYWACLHPNPSYNKCADGYTDVIDPARYADFYYFAKQVVARYAVSPYTVVKMVEIINEPDVLNGWGANDAQIDQYAVLLQNAYSQIHTVKPDLPVMIGGLAYTPGLANTNFLPRVLASAGLSTDAINFHHYDDNLVLNNYPNQEATVVAQIRNTSGASGKPLIWSEGGALSANVTCGSSTHYGDPVSQAAYVPRMLGRAFSLDVKTTTWFWFHDFLPSGNPCPYYYYGLVTAQASVTPGTENSLKPSYTAFQAAAYYMGDLNSSYRLALTSANLWGPAGAGEGYSFNRQHPGDVNYGLIVAWENQPGVTLAISTNSTFIGFADINGSFKCFTYYPSRCQQSGNWWIWPFDNEPGMDPKSPIYALLQTVYP